MTESSEVNCAVDPAGSIYAISLGFNLHTAVRACAEWGGGVAVLSKSLILAQTCLHMPAFPTHTVCSRHLGQRGGRGISGTPLQTRALALLPTLTLTLSVLVQQYDRCCMRCYATVPWAPIVEIAGPKVELPK